MSSFSSVIRKPGAKPAPKAAPRRNIVRKPPPAAAAHDADPTPALTSNQLETQADAVTEAETPTDTAVETPVTRATDFSDSVSLQPAPGPASHDDSQPRNGIPQSDIVPSQENDERERNTAGSQSLETLTPAPQGEPEPVVASISPARASVHFEESSSPSRLAAQRRRESTEHGSSTRSSVTGLEQSQRQQRRPSASRQRVDSARSTITASAPAHGSQSQSTVAASEQSLSHTGSEPEPRPSTPSVAQVSSPVRSHSRPTERTSSSSVPPPETRPVAQSSPTALTNDPSRSAVSQRRASGSSQRSEAQVALDQVNSKFQQVGDIAASIIRDTPAPDSSTEVDDQRPRKRRKRNTANDQTAEEHAADIVVAATRAPRASGRKRVRGERRATPENAEDHVVEPGTTTMFDLCDDKHKWGKKSEIEKQMAENWTEILARRREDAAERFQKAQEGRRKKDKLSIPDQAAGGGDMGAVPELVIENGQLVVASRDVDRHADTTNAANAVTDADIREDTDIYKRINSATVGPQRGHIAPGQTWDDLSTEMFYSGLKMFGTDFKMISNMIPGKNRKQVKLKYNTEERLNWAKVRRCLDQKEEVSLDNYATMTGIQFGSVADVYKQMEEDEKKLREEDESRRRDEGIISRNPADHTAADVPMPSIEGQEADADAEDSNATVLGSDRQSTASRLGSTTTTSRQTAQPLPAASGKRGNDRRGTGSSRQGRQGARNKQSFEGVEERLGDVTEISIPGA